MAEFPGFSLIHKDNSLPNSVFIGWEEMGAADRTYQCFFFLNILFLALLGLPRIITCNYPQCTRLPSLHFFLPHVHALKYPFPLVQLLHLDTPLPPHKLLCEIGLLFSVTI